MKSTDRCKLVKIPQLLAQHLPMEPRRLILLKLRYPQKRMRIHIFSGGIVALLSAGRCCDNHRLVDQYDDNDSDCNSCYDDEESI
jgi:hypothetical protein